MAITREVLQQAEELRRGTNISIVDAVAIAQAGSATNALIPAVLPGDLITASLANLIINRLNDVYVRMSSIETEGTSTSTVVISSLDPPSGTVKVGELLTVNGRNFGVSTGLARIHVDDTAITGLQSGSDQQLVFRIPLTFIDVPSAGRPATLTITNQSTTAQRTILLQPALAAVGAVDVNPRGVEPATPLSNTQATFEFQLISQATLDTTCNLTALVVPSSGQDWQSRVRILDSNKATELREVQLVPRQPRTVFVRIDPIPVGSDAVTFTVTLNVRSANGSVSGSSGAKTFTVGSVADQPDTTVTLNAPSIEPITGTASVTPSAITLGSPGVANLTYPVAFTVAGTYDIEVALGGGAANWDLGIVNPPTTPIGLRATLSILGTELTNPQGRASKTITIALGRKSTSVAGNVVLKVKRQGETRMASKTMQLQLG